jgi:hypothetical protein
LWGPHSLSGHSGKEKYFCPAELRLCDCPPRSLTTTLTELLRGSEFRNESYHSLQSYTSWAAYS